MTEHEMHPTIEKVASAQEQVSEAQLGVSEARKALTEATEAYRRASAELARVMEEAQSEVTPELVSQAEAEHKEFLNKELQEALADKRYSEVALIAQKLGEMEKADAEVSPEGPEKTELEKAVDGFFERNGIGLERDRKHYREKVKIMVTNNDPEDVSVDEIIDALQREFDRAKKEVPKADPNWADRRAA